ncbi:hypothetical protein HY523_02695 [Candidatus Berkelbacteria bacterium]|nr:hypothetical protein [Candidatus Berkelbacteria bacterium]
MSKIQEKQQACELRRQGFSYTEILEQIPVSRSTLSLWLRTMGLAREHKQRFTEKRRKAQQRGGEKIRQVRILETKILDENARQEVKTINQRELWLIGIALYWAEGTKERAESSRSQRVTFSNSDPKMILVFLRWLTEVIKIKRDTCVFELYIHEHANSERARNYWARILGLKPELLIVRYKRHTIRTNRKKVGDHYFGLIRVTVRSSTNLNRKINAWIEGIFEYSGFV